MAARQSAIEREDMKIRRLITLLVGITSVALSPMTWAAGHGGGGGGHGGGGFGGGGFHGGWGVHCGGFGGGGFSRPPGVAWRGIFVRCAPAPPLSLSPLPPVYSPPSLTA